MSVKKIIVIVGATGLQGNGLAKAILNDINSEYSVRAITRDPNSEKAKELERLGAEIVIADISDLESLKKAFSGAYGAYIVSFFWHHLDTARDLQDIKNMATASKETGLKHVVYSTLEDTREYYPAGEGITSEDGKYRAAHMDVKGEGDQFFTDLEVPTTLLLTCFYWENFYNQGTRPARHNGVTLLTFPPMGERLWPGIAVEDIGKAAYGIFKNGTAYFGKTVGIAGGHLTGKDYAEGLSKVLAEQITFSPPTLDAFRNFEMPFIEDIANSFQFAYDFNDEFAAARDIEFTRKINPELQSFDQWAEANKERLKID